MNEKLTTPQLVREYALNQAKANRKPETVEIMKAYEVAAGQAARYMFPADFDGLKVRFSTYKNSVNPVFEHVFHAIAEMM